MAPSDIELTFDQTCNLIDHVRNLPCLYDPKADFYANRTVNRNSWITVCKQMNVRGLTGNIQFNLKSIDLKIHVKIIFTTSS